MRYVLVSAFNKIINNFMPPQFIQDMTDEDIIESNVNAVKLGKVDKDIIKTCDIYKLGYFDNHTAQFDLLDRPQLLVNLSQYLPTEVIKAEVENNVQSN